VLLFLTSEFAADPGPAITAAARAARCTQVAGCTAAGVFTEQDWVLDAPAAAALVLGEGAGLGPMCAEAGACLTFCAPNAVDLNWLTSGTQRFGGVAGDASGHGPYTVWSGGRVRGDGRAELAVTGARLSLGISQGVRPLSRPAAIDQVEGYELLRVGNQPALTSLVRELPLSSRAPERIPTHLLMAGVTFGEQAHALEEGRFRLMPVMAANADAKSVTVAGELAPGMALFWAMRQPQAAEQDMQAMLERLDSESLDAPAFGLMFPCMGRGPYFYGGQDRDIEAFTRRFPEVPLIGFYGNGEIARLDGANRVLQYSVVLGLGYDV